MYSNTDKRNSGKKTQPPWHFCFKQPLSQSMRFLFWLLPFLLIVSSKSLLKQTFLHFPTCPLWCCGILSLADLFCVSLPQAMTSRKGVKGFSASGRHSVSTAELWQEVSNLTYIRKTGQRCLSCCCIYRTITNYKCFEEKKRGFFQRDDVRIQINLLYGGFCLLIICRKTPHKAFGMYKVHYDSLAR